MDQELKDAYWLFNDICSMINGDTPVLLKLPNLPKSVGFELLESILKAHPDLFKTNPDLSKTLKQKLCPIIIKSFSEKTEFTVATRILRLVLILIKNFNDLLATEMEIFIIMLIKILEPENHLWYRVLAAEIFWYICNDTPLLVWFYKNFDAEDKENSPKLFKEIITAVGKLSTEKPTNHGVVISAASLKGNAPDPNLSANFHGGDKDWGLTHTGSSLKVKMIDQLDKSEPPAIPENYLLFLCLNSFHALTDGQCRLGTPAFNQSVGFQIDEHGSTTQSEIQSTLPPVLSTSELLESEDIKILTQMTTITWPGLLASLSFFIKLPMDEELTFILVNSLQNFTHLCGVLHLTTPREAFLTCLYRNSFPYLAAYDHQDSNLMINNNNNAPPSLSSTHILYIQALLNIASSLAECLGSSWFLILDALQHIQHFLNAGYKVHHRQLSSPYQNTSKNGKDSPTHQNEADLSDLRVSINRLLGNIKYLSDAAFEDFLKSLCRLCTESAGVPFTLSGFENQQDTDAEPSSPTNSSGGAKSSETKGRGVTVRRQLFKQNDILSSIDQLRQTCLQCLPKLINTKSNQKLWNLVLINLIRITNGILTPSGVKVQACQAINEIILNGYNCASSLLITGQSKVQIQLLTPLAIWMGITEYGAVSTSGVLVSDIGGQCAALEVLDKLLQNAGQSLTEGWKIIFDILNAACYSLLNQKGGSQKGSNSATNTPEQAPLSPNLSQNSSKSNRNSELVRNAFRCLQLITNEFLAQLPPSRLKDCIYIVGQFGCQKEDLNTSLTAIGMLWNCLDYIQRKHSELPNNDKKEKDSTVELIPFKEDISDEVDSFSLSQLWLNIVFKLSQLSLDTRPEVRHASNQTFFRAIMMVTSSFSTSNLWYTCLKSILFPMIENINQIYYGILINSGDSKHLQIENPEIIHHSRNSAQKQWDETRALILNGLVGVYSEKLPNFVNLPQFKESIDNLLQYLRDSSLLNSKEISLAALTNFQKFVGSFSKLEIDEGIKSNLVEQCWVRWLNIGNLITEESVKSFPYRAISYSGNKKLSLGEVPKLQKISQLVLTKFMEIFPNLWKLNRTRVKAEEFGQIRSILNNLVNYPYSEDFKPDLELVNSLQDSILEGLKPLEFELQSVPNESFGIELLLLYSNFIEFSWETTDLKTARIKEIYQLEDKLIPKLPSYLALGHQLTQIYPQLFNNHSDFKILYESGTFSKILKNFSIPMTLRYNLKTSKSENLPLWKEITKCWISIVTSSVGGLDQIIKDLDSKLANSILGDILDSFELVLLSDLPLPQDLSPKDSDLDERFDIENLIAIFLKLTPLFSNEKVESDLIVKFVNILERGTKLGANTDSNTSQSESNPISATLTREQLGFTYLKCLTSLCIKPELKPKPEQFELTHEKRNSDHFQGVQSSAVNYDQMLAAEVPSKLSLLASPILLSRCKQILEEFNLLINNLGKRPLPRVKRECLMFLLVNFPQIELTEGCCNDLLNPKPEYEHLRKSNLSHLFLFYNNLINLLNCKDPELIGLISGCLLIVGKELGI
jgi:hypothetical protein